MRCCAHRAAGSIAATRAYFEPRFGRDLSHVRVHADAQAAASARLVGARAYTVGRDIVFGAEQSAADRPLLAHELAHAIQQSSVGSAVAVQRAPVGGSGSALRPLDEIAHGIARLLRGESFAADTAGTLRGPVLSVVRDDLGRIYLGLNEGLPRNLSGVMEQAIRAQNARIAAGEVVVVRTSPLARGGGHAEVNAVNSAVVTRERELGRALTELDLRSFELHNVWLSGQDRALTAAPRCEHCARITRGVSVTDPLFHAEGGVSGTIDPTKPPRPPPAPLTPPAGTAPGEIDTSKPRPKGPGGASARVRGSRGSGGERGGSPRGTALARSSGRA